MKLEMEMMGEMKVAVVRLSEQACTCDISRNRFVDYFNFGFLCVSVSVSSLRQFTCFDCDGEVTWPYLLSGRRDELTVKPPTRNASCPSHFTPTPTEDSWTQGMALELQCFYNANLVSQKSITANSMSLNINLNLNITDPLDVVCAVRNNMDAFNDLTPYCHIVSQAATAILDEIKALPYEITPVGDVQKDDAARTINFTVRRLDGSTIQITNIESNATTAELFHRLHVETGLSTDQMRFITSRALRYTRLSMKSTRMGTTK